MGGVPAMMTALTTHSDFEKTDTSCLKVANLGATTVLPQTIQFCTDVLRFNKVNKSFGMTETGVPWTLVPGEDPVDKHPQLGHAVRICDPDTGKVLPRGEPGELHHGGNTVVARYWLAKDVDPEKANSCFYDDKYGHWMKTGDRAAMSENGYPQIIGRYKDIIIRGGENIASRAIESVLADIFGLTAVVVGVPDDIAGEVRDTTPSKQSLWWFCPRFKEQLKSELRCWIYRYRLR
jgi:acyl-CoA synthetase (AMP-forming)/AMP-acid ligase II